MIRKATIAAVTVVLAAAVISPGSALSVRERTAIQQADLPTDSSFRAQADSVAGASSQSTQPIGPVQDDSSGFPWTFLLILLGIGAVYAVWEIVMRYREKARDSDLFFKLIEPQNPNPQGTRTVWPPNALGSKPTLRPSAARSGAELDPELEPAPWAARQPSMLESAALPSPEPVRHTNMFDPEPPSPPRTARPPAAFEPAPAPAAETVWPAHQQSAPPPAPVVPEPPAPAIPERPAPAVPERPAPREPARMSAREGTLVLMPGRLEIISGNDQRKEIRFVKVPGTNVVTFGRHEGDHYTHVRLESPTVSRMHATMRFVDGHWFIRNLSATNPVVLNGERLMVDEPEQELHEGDRVEMGEMIFRFRSR